MEALTRLVSESLARHGFDRPLDYRRLQWSRWFRCESHHSLLLVPSKPGVFALAEEIMDFGQSQCPCGTGQHAHVATVPDVAMRSLGRPVWDRRSAPRQAERSSAADSRQPQLAGSPRTAACSPSPNSSKTTTWPSSSTACSRARIPCAPASPPAATSSASSSSKTRPSAAASAAALNQWMVSAAEKATGIGSHFATSLELTPATEYIPQAE